MRVTHETRQLQSSCRVARARGARAGWLARVRAATTHALSIVKFYNFHNEHGGASLPFPRCAASPVLGRRSRPSSAGCSTAEVEGLDAVVEGELPGADGWRRPSAHTSAAEAAFGKLASGLGSARAVLGQLRLCSPLSRRLRPRGGSMC